MRQHGFTLTELVVVIIVIGLSGAALLRVFVVSRAGAPTPAQITVADQLAQERMELILGTRQTLGFLSIVDPCVAAPAIIPCVAVPGYAVNTTGVPAAVNWSVDPIPAHFRVVTVTVKTPTGTQLSSLTAVLGNY